MPQPTREWAQTGLLPDETDWFARLANDALCDPHEIAKAHAEAEILVWRSGGVGAGFVALIWGEDQVEIYILSVDPAFRRQGVATRMLHGVRDRARKRGISRIQLVTNNGNFRALQLYQVVGFRLTALYPGRFERERGYPRVDENGIRVSDALELTWDLDE